jgi:hypothetical protein
VKKNEGGWVLTAGLGVGLVVAAILMGIAIYL